MRLFEGDLKPPSLAATLLAWLWMLSLSIATLAILAWAVWELAVWLV